MSRGENIITVEELLANAGWVRAVARGLLGDEHTTEDAVQDTWLAALESGPRDPSKLGAWLGSVVRNKARSRLRTARKRRHEPLTDTPGGAPSPAELVERIETQRRLAEAVIALEEPYRQAVILRFFEERSPVAIARQLGVPPSTVRTRIHRGIERLRKRLDARFGDRQVWQLALVPLAFPDGVGSAAGAASAAGATLLASKGFWCVALVLLFATGATLWLWTPEHTPAGSGEGVVAGRAVADPSGSEPTDALVARGPRKREATAPELRDAETARTSDAREASPIPEDAVPDDVARIRGRVWVRGGGSLAGHRVFVWGGEQPGDTVHPDGTFVIDSPHSWREKWLFLEHHGTQIKLGSVETAKGKETVVDLEVDPGESLDIRILDPEGQPVPEARITLRRNASQAQAGSVWTRTDLIGRVRVSFLPRDFYRVEVDHPDFTYHERRIEVPVAGELEISLVPARPLHVTLENFARYAGVRRISLEMVRDPLELSAMEQFSYPLQPDSQGRAVVNAPPPGSWRLRVYGTADFPCARNTLEVPAGTEPLEVTFTLQEPVTTTIAGVLLDPFDEPIPGLRVYVGMQWAETDIHGTFEIDGVQPGDRQVMILLMRDATRVGYHFSQLRVAETEQPELEIVMPGTRTLHIELAQFPSTTLAQKVEILVSPRAPGALRYVHVEPRGRSELVIPHLPAGKYRIQLLVDHNSYPASSITISDEEDEVRHQITHREFHEVRFVVTVPEGARLPNGLSLESPPQPKQSDYATDDEHTDAWRRWGESPSLLQHHMEMTAHGDFRCKLVPGVYAVELTAAGFQPETLELRVPEHAGEVISVDLTVAAEE